MIILESVYIFISFYVKIKSLLVNLVFFLNFEDYNYLMGYDKSFIFDMEEVDEKKLYEGEKWICFLFVFKCYVFLGYNKIVFILLLLVNDCRNKIK